MTYRLCWCTKINYFSHNSVIEDRRAKNLCHIVSFGHFLQYLITGLALKVRKTNYLIT